ncbi:protogenin isoform X2 [Cephus cinctus]|uniref:Protogenin isoform X2 n=1 Tax=Cephus cinctus TaxID=211228 RepID=A0AAJ7W2J6_CEPCN|nr:protogenin isoform X2 [Cephus cinctus]
MAARVLLLSILFTEVLKPVCVAGVRGIGSGVNGKNGSKPEGLDADQNVSAAKLEIEPSGHVVLGRRGITLNCVTGANYNVSWLYNGAPAPPCGIARCTLLPNGSLHFYKKQNLQMPQRHRGWNLNNTSTNKTQGRNEYRCVARTKFGGSLRSGPTYVQIAELSHVFKESPGDLIMQEGEVARFSCLIDSVPFPPNITWQHNGDTVVPEHNNTKYSVVPPGVLYISATKPSDAGSYRCVATNDFLKKTKKSKEARLTVTSESDKAKSRMPTSLYPQIRYNHWLINGSNLHLACAASGYPPPVITWTFIPRYPDGTNFEQPRVLLNLTGGIGILSLKSVGVADAGIYLCAAKNSVNDAPQIQNITVDVMVPPTLRKKPVSFVCPNGRTARFECQADGLPTPQIYWLKDATNINTINGRGTTYSKVYNKMELAISATVPSDSGIYQCVAVNSAGEIWAAGRLQVNTSRNSPAAPTSMKCHALSPYRIFISWEHPKSLPPTSITAYTVHYSAVGGKEEVTPPEPGNSTSVEVTKTLEPLTNYSFYIRVWNNHGASNQSATIVCSTAPSVPKAVPKIKLDVISSTKLNVSWGSLTKKEAQGVVIEYKLQWKLQQHPSIHVLCIPSTTEYYTLTGLTPGAQYDLRVLARTEQGWPNVSESELSWTSVTMPLPKTNQFTITNMVNLQLTTTNSSFIKVKWEMKEETHQKNKFKFDSWRIYCENVDGKKLATVLLPINATEYTINNLLINEPYIVALCAVSFGEDKSCLRKHADTARSSTTSIPTGLEATPISPTSINVTWTVSDVIDVHSYELCYHSVHPTEPEISNCLVTGETRITVDHLKPFTLYQFKVRIFYNESNDSGSEFSESIECYTNEDVPGKVEEVQWFLGNGSKVRIAWKEPEKLNGVIKNYSVAYTMNLSDSSLTWGNVTVPGNKTSTSLPGLIPGKRYFVMVKAATKAGYGKSSDPIFIITGGTSSKVHTTSDNRTPPPSPKPDQSLGVILGVSISIGCVVICLCSIYCRKKCENSRSLGDTVQPFKGRVLVRNGNGCCVDRSSVSNSQHVNTATPGNEIELAVLCPSSPVMTDPRPDTKPKGGYSNGVLESCAKEPLLAPWNATGESKDVRITENPQYKRRASAISNQQQQPDQEDQELDLEGTQLTMVNCTLDSSSSSLNNNLGCTETSLSSSPRKTASTSVPVLNPNG